MDLLNSMQTHSSAWGDKGRIYMKMCFRVIQTIFRASSNAPPPNYSPHPAPPLTRWRQSTARVGYLARQAVCASHRSEYTSNFIQSFHSSKAKWMKFSYKYLIDLPLPCCFHLSLAQVRCDLLWNILCRLYKELKVPSSFPLLCSLFCGRKSF